MNENRASLLNEIIFSMILTVALVSLLISCSNSLVETIERDIARLETHTVTYDGNGSDSGLVPSDGTIYKEGALVTIRGPGSMSKSGGYSFYAWNTESDGSGTHYAEDDIFQMGSSDVILYARWTLLPIYTVTFNSQGGSTVPSQNIIEGEKAEEPEVPIKVENVFAGWFKDSSCLVAWDFENDIVASNITIFAKWISNQYYFSLDIVSGNIGTGSIDTATSGLNGLYDYGTSLTAKATENADSIFMGWFSDVDGNSLVSLSNPYTFSISKDTNLFAKFDIQPGYKSTYALNTASFNLLYCPGGTFPIGRTDSDEATVNSFFIAETEVTYQLWSEVYSWATSLGGYTFSNTGRQGGDLNSGPVGTYQHPVTTISWRDSIVWLNALTEYYNLTNMASLTPVYIYNSTIIRNANDTTACDNAINSISATGFRLPYHNEWECAARWKGNNDDNGAIERPLGSNIFWSPGDYASGSIADTNNFDAVNAVAWFGNSTTYGIGNTTSTQAVKSKTPNDLGIYDMTGNVWEHTFTILSGSSSSSERCFLGGCWGNGLNWLLQIGYWGSGSYTGWEDAALGFRLVKSP
jgi:formylglycine-generating enzyme required for sulfatase activity